MEHSDHPTLMFVYLSWSDLDYLKTIPKKIQPLIKHWKQIDLFLGGTKCDALCRYKERVYYDGKCPIILQSQSGHKNCNHKALDEVLHQPVAACTSMSSVQNSKEIEGWTVIAETPSGF